MLVCSFNLGVVSHPMKKGNVLQYRRHSLVMIQKWESGEEMERYIRSSMYRSVQELLELSIEQPKVSFDMVSWTMGMKYLNAVRG